MCFEKEIVLMEYEPIREVVAVAGSNTFETERRVSLLERKSVQNISDSGENVSESNVRQVVLTVKKYL